jgi:protein-S-isoprenylcysteine O-methyltransferase Ste14
MKTDKDNPGVLAPPPLIFLGGLIIGWLLAWLFPGHSLLPSGWNQISGMILIAIGLVIIVAAIVQMRRAQTNVEPWKPTTKILDTGLYSISRNPIYIAMTLVYLGIAFLVNSFWFLPPLILVLPAIYYGVILREEKYLERKFGDEYLNYKTSVRRWF